jgi:hypothetical protein
MSTTTETQPTLWNAPNARQGQRPHAARSSCALCASAPPATPLGLCRECLAAAAAEHAVVTSATDRRLSAVPFRELCGRCGSSKHLTVRCDA